MKDALGHGSNPRGTATDPAAATRANAGGTRASRARAVAAAQSQAQGASHQSRVDAVGRLSQWGGAALHTINAALRDSSGGGKPPDPFVVHQVLTNMHELDPAHTAHFASELASGFAGEAGAHLAVHAAHFLADLSRREHAR